MAYRRSYSPRGGREAFEADAPFHGDSAVLQAINALRNDVGQLGEELTGRLARLEERMASVEARMMDIASRPSREGPGPRTPDEPVRNRMFSDPNVRLCDLCGVTYQANVAVQHFNGKRHQQELRRVKEEEETARERARGNFVFIGGAPRFYGPLGSRRQRPEWQSRRPQRAEQRRPHPVLPAQRWRLVPSHVLMSSASWLRPNNIIYRYFILS